MVAGALKLEHGVLLRGVGDVARRKVLDRRAGEDLGAIGSVAHEVERLPAATRAGVVVVEEVEERLVEALLEREGAADVAVDHVLWRQQPRRAGLDHARIGRVRRARAGIGGELPDNGCTIGGRHDAGAVGEVGLDGRDLKVDRHPELVDLRGVEIQLRRGGIDRELDEVVVETGSRRHAGRRPVHRERHGITLIRDVYPATLERLDGRAVRDQNVEPERVIDAIHQVRERERLDGASCRRVDLCEIHGLAVGLVLRELVRFGLAGDRDVQVRRGLPSVIRISLVREPDLEVVARGKRRAIEDDPLFEPLDHQLRTAPPRAPKRRTILACHATTL